MKLITNKLKLILLSFTCLAFLLVLTSQQCSEKVGCIERKKFITYVTSISNDGETSKIVSDVNYKIIYLRDSALSIVDSVTPNDKIIEKETNINYGTNASRIVRIISYSQMILDCGKLRNKFCLVEEYHDKKRLVKAIEGIKKMMSKNIQYNCIVIPFFEYGYVDDQDKVALLCLPESKDLYDVMKFRDELSHIIEKVQVNEANNKDSSFNGIERPIHKFITYNPKKMAVAVNTQIKQNIIYMWNDDYSWIKSYSLYEQKGIEGFACPVSTALAKKPQKLAKWNSGLKPQPKPDGCLFLGGDSEDLLLCVADDSGNLETNDENISSELKETNRELHDFIYRVKLLSSYEALLEDKKVRDNCYNNSWNVFRNRLQSEADWALNNCKNIFINVDDETRTKSQKCMTQYTNALQNEKIFLTKKNPLLEKAFDKCVKAVKPNLYSPSKLNSSIKEFMGGKTISFFFKQKSKSSYSNKYESTSGYYNKNFPFISFDEKFESDEVDEY